jgi:hypothetical protein
MRITNQMIKYAHSRSEWAMFAIIVSGFNTALNDVATTHVTIHGIVRATTDRKQLAICNPLVIEERHVA